jgi:Bacterial SCP ortholog
VWEPAPRDVARFSGTFRCVPSRQQSAERALAALAAQLSALGVAPPERSDYIRKTLAELQSACVDAVLAALDAGAVPDRDALRVAVRYLLDQLASAVPGRAVEVRVPPYGAVQCMAGPRHSRGTPPNVIETGAVSWLLLATGRLAWQDAVARGEVRASGPRADLSAYLPVGR